MHPFRASLGLSFRHNIDINTTVEHPIKDSLLRTQYKKTSILRTRFLSPKYTSNVILPVKKGNLPIKNNLGQNETGPKMSFT